MSAPFVAEIRILACNFAPKGWAMCNGQILPISQNTALFSLLGTFYGGDGKSTFALPNLQGSAPMHQGDGPGLSQHFLGEQSGVQHVTLITTEMPAHTHTVGCDSGTGSNSVPTSGMWAATGRGRPQVYSSNAPGSAGTVSMNPLALSVTGGSQPHNNMPPYLTLNFCIALQGIFPARS